jgi:hypothetical protein
MDDDEAMQPPPMAADDASPAVAPAPKRPRVGRAAGPLLAAIEADCGAGAGGMAAAAPPAAAPPPPAWTRPLREALLSLAAPAGDVFSAARAVRAAAAVAARSAGDGAPAAVAEIVCEA